MAISVATLGALSLPLHFSYKPYVGRKRVSTLVTATAVIVQSSNPVIVHGDGYLEWTCEKCFPTEYDSILELYNESTLTPLIFNGYWGESLRVYFTELDPPSVKSRLFDLSGMFQVIEVLTAYNPSC
jgi:hypothetical protein